MTWIKLMVTYCLSYLVIETANLSGYKGYFLNISQFYIPETEKKKKILSWHP